MLIGARLMAAPLFSSSGVGIESAAQARGMLRGVLQAAARLLVLGFAGRAASAERWLEAWMDAASVQATLYHETTGGEVNGRVRAFMQFQKRVVGGRHAA